MKFAIFGAGGLGGYFGARLADAGHEVCFIARGEHLNAIRTSGLKILSPLGDLVLQDLQISEHPEDFTEVDAIVLAVKTWQVPDAAKAMQPLVGSHTVVVPFLNGVEACEQLSAVINPHQVLGGLSRIFSFIDNPGVIRHINDSAYLEIGELDGQKSERVSDLVNAFASAGCDAVVSENIQQALWQKLVTVSSWAGLGALARMPMGVLRDDPDTRKLIDQSMAEGIAVAKAAGHDIDDDFKNVLWRFYDDLPGDATASMQRDIMAERPSELDAWNGAIVNHGENLSVDTPIHRFTYHTLKPMEAAARKIRL